jgi:DNA invertase Pin-like site-specific DNA recombinase
MRAAGMGYRKIAAALGVNVGQVYKWCNDVPYK